MKNLTWQNPEQLFVAQELINKVKSKCCGIKDKYKYLYKYQYVNKTDTLIKTDSIQVPYPVEKQLAKWQQFKLDLGGIAMLIIIVIVFILLGRTVHRLKI